MIRTLIRRSVSLEKIFIGYTLNIEQLRKLKKQKQRFWQMVEQLANHLLVEQRTISGSKVREILKTMDKKAKQEFNSIQSLLNGDKS